MTRILVLNSGGLDSTTCVGLAVAKVGNLNVSTVTIDYGQRHKKEIECARLVARHYNLNNYVLKLDLTQIGGSSLTSSIEVPNERNLHEMTIKIPNTWVPQRNTLFLTMVHALAEVKGFDEIWIGANQIDFSGYPDCRESFFKKLQEALNFGSRKFTEEGKEIKIIAPLQFMNKATIIKTGIELEVPYHLTTSCYNGKEKACSKCDSCILRLNGFKEVGVKDPIEYETTN